MNDVAGDFVITVHALERFQERFPELWDNDPDTGELIHRECLDALNEGRTGNVAPLELAHYDPVKWQAGKCYYAWTPDKQRGYAIADSDGDAIVVTVLKGQTHEEARKMRYEGQLPRKREDEDPADTKVAG